MTDGQKPCPICHLNAQIERRGGVDTFEMECKRCGRYAITKSLMYVMEKLSGEKQQLRPYLSAYTRQTNNRGIVGVLTSENWEDLAAAHTTTSVSQKIIKLLELVGARSSYPGKRVSVNAEIEYPLMDAGSGAELTYVLNHLIDLGHLSRDGPSFYLTVKGWERLELPTGGGIPGRCFVAMSFDPSLNDAYELGIRVAVIECKFQPIRIDLEHHNEKICDRILAEIRRSQFVVADFTLQRAGVYFEAGFAMALGRPVIWTCHKDDIQKTHFDTRQYNHIVWATPDDLKAKLAERIQATILT